MAFIRGSNGGFSVVRICLQLEKVPVNDRHEHVELGLDRQDLLTDVNENHFVVVIFFYGLMFPTLFHKH